MRRTSFWFLGFMYLDKYYRKSAVSSRWVCQHYVLNSDHLQKKSMFKHGFVVSILVLILSTDVCNAYTAKQLNGKWRNICAPCQIPGAPLPFDRCVTDVIFIGATKSFTELVSCEYFGSTYMARKWGSYTVVGRRIVRKLTGYSPTSDPLTGEYMAPPPAGQYDILKLTTNTLTVRDLLGGVVGTLKRVIWRVIPELN